MHRDCNVRHAPIPGQPGYFAVEDGRIWSDKSSTYLKPNSSGGRKYQSVIFGRDSSGKRKRLYIHRLVLISFVGPCPDGMECRHLDGNPSNNRLDNLQWGTKIENMVDRKRHGREAKRQRSGRYKLTQAQVDEIMALRIGPHEWLMPMAVIASRYGIHKNTVSKIGCGYKHYGVKT